MSSLTAAQIPVINFSGLDLSKPRSEKWEEVRAEVMAAIGSHGFFHATFDDRLSPKQLDDFIGEPLEELFRVPLESKMKILTDNHYESYMGPNMGFDTFEIIIIKDPPKLEAVEDFARIMWPESGNPSFCNKAWNICKPLGEMDLIIRRMILEAFHADRHFDSHVEATRQVIRFARYDPPGDQDSRINMPEHTDMNALSIVYQHDEQGLEVQASDGQWVEAPLNSFTVLIGETLMAMTNAGLKPTLHRVKMPKNNTRYSLGYSSHFKDGCMIEVLEELVDKEHPKLFNSYDYPKYMKFRITEAGRKAKRALTAYCGIGAHGDAA